jgi:hypothetical protein
MRVAGKTINAKKMANLEKLPENKTTRSSPGAICKTFVKHIFIAVLK